MKEINIEYFKSPYGELILGALDHQLVLCDWLYRKKRKTIDHRIQGNFKAIYVEKPSQCTNQAVAELEQYFKRERQIFDVQYLLSGTNFQLKVWKALENIPYGTTRTYGELAISLNMPEAVRAVAAANGANALAIIIPCHRITGQGGELTGYAGGITVKQKLLELENKGSKTAQIKLFE